MKKYRFRVALCGLSAAFLAVGCGKQETYIPTDKLTPEQEAAVKAEDEAVFDEEAGGGGTYVAPSKKKK